MIPYFEWPIIYDVRTHPKVLNSKTGSKDLQMVDITIRVNGGEAYFLEDHNSARNVMPHNNRKELVKTILDELDRNHREHFGHL